MRSPPRATCFRRWSSTAPTPSSSWTRQGKILFLSPTSERLLGYPIAERLGESAFENVHPDDVPGLEATFAELLRQPRVPKTIVARTLHRDGGWRYIEAVAVNRLDEPAVGAIVANFRDITERRRAEEALRASEAKYRFFIERAAFGIYRSTEDGRILEATRRSSACSATTTRRGSACSSTWPTSISRAADRAALLEAHRGQAGGTVEMRWKKKNGEPILVRLTARTIVGSRRPGIVRDDRRRRHREARARGTAAAGAEDGSRRPAGARRRARLQQRARGDRRLGGAARPHRYPDGHPSHIEAVEIRKAAEKGASFTKQLMAFSRRQALEPQPVDLHAAGAGFESTLQRIIGADVATTVRTRRAAADRAHGARPARTDPDEPGRERARRDARRAARSTS